MPTSWPSHRVSDLRFQVFARSIHPEWFAVRGHRRIVQDLWEVDVRIVAGGHAVAWRSEGFRLTETLTGPDTGLPEPGPGGQPPARQLARQRM